MAARKPRTVTGRTASKTVNDIPHREFMRILVKMETCSGSRDWVRVNQYSMREAWLRLQQADWADTFITGIGGKFAEQVSDIMYPYPYPEWWNYVRDDSQGSPIDAVRLDRFRQAVPFEMLLRVVRRKFGTTKRKRG